MVETRHGIPYPGPPPVPEPAHQKRIARQKLFEIGTVVLLVCAGAGLLMWREARSKNAPDPARTLAESREVIQGTIQSSGGAPTGAHSVFGRDFLTFRQEVGDFACHIALVGKGAESPLETAIIWITPVPGREAPSAGELQRVVDTVALLAQRLVKSSSRAVETAATTMEGITDVERPHDKGVGATGDGWKVTYVTFRGYDEKGPPVPVLYLVLQRLSAASDPALADFNQALYEAVNRGVDVISALSAAADGK